jgi:sulfur carrier protein
MGPRNITLNGKPKEIEGEPTITELLQTLAVRPEQVAVAVNGEVVPRGEWPGVRINGGDTVEVVRAVGGG